MSEPKRKHSKARRNRRRSQIKIRLRKPQLCRHCQAEKLSHRRCPNCGKY